MQTPDPGRLSDLSSVVRSNKEEVLELRLSKSGHWRETVRLSEIDPQLIDLLIAYEDKRYWQHSGVDPLAIIRALKDYFVTGRVTSGASTLTMQTARLMRPELGKKSVFVKLHQILEALRLEAHWTKDEILEAYFTLAPYGGNIEGIKAASAAWFQKPPLQLTVSEAALLTALPQSPEKRRPDRYSQKAFLAKSRVLEAIKDKLSLTAEEIVEYKAEALPARRYKPSSHSAHFADRFARVELGQRSTLDKEWQTTVKKIVFSATNHLPEPINAAAMVVERKTGKVRAYVGSSDYLSQVRKGGINYLKAVRSPGSTLKPFIYAKALQRNIISKNEVFEDMAIQTAGYSPTNFDQSFSGEVTLKDALLRSLNIPAITTLEKINVKSFENDLRSYLGQNFAHSDYAGLSLAVGGFYMTAEDLMSLYLEFADPGSVSGLSFFENSNIKNASFLFEEKSARAIQNMLIQYDGAGRRVAFKTGTSHNRQDAWTVQLTENHIVLAWLGTPDNETTQILTGRSAAFPMTEKIVNALGLSSPYAFKEVGQFNEDEELALKSCDRLIQFPENGEWIRSDSLALSVGGPAQAVWYLDGKPMTLEYGQMILPDAGVHRITARLDNCKETNEIFMDYQKN
ncbi:MAG: penicillin-binding protein 1C [Aestuariivita sp.]|nr:penicillin-binding protein 1C [Aestuariivita sp.]